MLAGAPARPPDPAPPASPPPETPPAVTRQQPQPAQTAPDRIFTQRDHPQDVMSFLYGFQPGRTWLGEGATTRKPPRGPRTGGQGQRRSQAGSNGMRLLRRGSPPRRRRSAPPPPQAARPRT